MFKAVSVMMIAIFVVPVIGADFTIFNDIAAMLADINATFGQ